MNSDLLEKKNSDENATGDYSYDQSKLNDGMLLLSFFFQYVKSKTLSYSSKTKLSDFVRLIIG